MLCLFPVRREIPSVYGSGTPRERTESLSTRLTSKPSQFFRLNMLVHIVDDDAEVRAATAYLLESHGFTTRRHASGADLLSSAELDGCILLDIRMPGMNGHAVQEELARRGIALPVIVMSAHGDLGAAVRAMKLGAADFIQKPPREADLLNAIRRAEEAYRKGADRRSAGAAAQARLQRLSRRESQTLQGLLAGLSNKAIARQLDLSPRTVEMHRANMMAELGVGTLSEALRLAIDGDLAPLGDGGGALATPAAPPQAGPSTPRSDAGDVGQKLELILDASGEGTFDWNLQTGEITLSRQRVQQLGLAAEAPRAERIEWVQGLMHPDDKSAYFRALEAHWAGETESYGCDYRMRSSDGSWRWQEARGRVVERDATSNTPLRMVGTVRDVTDQKQEEEKGREAAQLLDLAQRAAGAGIWEIDLATNHLHMCPRGRELHGLDPQGPAEMSMESWAQLVHPDDLPATLAAIDRAVATGEPCSAEFRVLPADPADAPRWVLALGRVMHDSEGRPTRLVGLSQDISERKAEARQSRRAQSDLIQFSGISAMDTMVSTLTHELNQPLTAMAHFARGITRRLAETGALDDESLRDALAGAERSAVLAADIVARLGSQIGSREPKRQPASLSRLVRESCALALIDADTNGIRHSLDLDRAADPVSVDPVQVQQLLLNLVRNAAEALMDVPVPRRRLHIATHRVSGDEIAVEMSDSGPGIADSVRDRLFEPFVTGKPEGTGIGLSICRNIVEAHGGRIDARDSPEGGALFRFTLKA